MAIPTTDMPGHKLLADKVDHALATCIESPAVEFMESQSWQGLRWGITKTVLAMGNLRDGGIILIGVSQRHGKWALKGISKRNLATYNADEVIEQINAYVSPAVALSIVTHEENRKSFLIIEVKEFHETPLVCKKNREDQGLYEGAVYVRPPGKAQTKRVTTAQEMHELLELAADKRAKRFLERARRIGLQPEAGSARRFEEELGGL